MFALVLLDSRSRSSAIEPVLFISLATIVINFEFATLLKQCVGATLEKWSNLVTIADAESRRSRHGSLARSVIVRKVRHGKSKRAPKSLPARDALNETTRNRL
jgi:hypothetical protein